MKVIRDTIKKEISKGVDNFPAKQIANRLAKTNKSISVDDGFIQSLLFTSKDSRYAFAVLALLFPHLDYKNGDFHLDHCHPLSGFNAKKLKAKGIVLNDENRDYFTDWDYFNSVINLQMLDGNENKSKNSKDLKIWVESTSPSLSKHYLPKELELSDFPIFVEKRMALLKKKLEEELTF